ncbi:hypothetical protein ACFSUS_28295 [Spirosoma soli]|uniref:Uncharacterized protein n=1 Tax=Spirosoma soli TaxID=1770529 RepID=A0ABW5MBY0_9BACT
MNHRFKNIISNWGWSLLSLACLQCTPDTPTKIDYDQLAAQLMTDLKPQVVGTWTLRQVHVSPNGPNRINRLNLTKDSTFQDLALLTVVPAAAPRQTLVDPRYTEYDGSIQYKTKTYPIQFNMWPGLRVYSSSQQGPQAFLLFSFRFSDGTRFAEAEETFLEDLGLINETFSLETTVGQPTMQWVGLSRGIQRIDFVKQP